MDALQRLLIQEACRELVDRFALCGEGWRFASREASFVLHATG